MKQHKRKRIAVFISGRGSNLRSLLQASLAPDYPAQIVLVISNKQDAKGLELAKDNAIAHHAFNKNDFETCEALEQAMHELLLEHKIDFICLAGYMRILGEKFVKKWQGRMINIHPSLLPVFKGLDTHARALAQGVCIHGCSVHFVTATMDEGPIIAQAAVPVLPNDDENTLSARVLNVEHKIYPHALELLATGAVRMSAHKALFRTPAQLDNELYLISPPISAQGE